MSEDKPVVFVVDDDPSVRRALRRLIRSVGLAVEVFASASDFLRYRRPRRPECLVLDMRLRDMSGVDVQRSLAEGGNNLPIVFITGYGTPELRESVLRAGAVDFLSKPFDERVLLDAIQRAFDEGRRGRQTPS